MIAPPLKQGSKGPLVRILQKALNAKGKLPKPIIEEEVFGPETKEAVKLFQKRMHLTVDGIVGPETAGALAKLCGPSAAAFGKAFGAADEGDGGPGEPEKPEAKKDDAKKGEQQEQYYEFTHNGTTYMLTEADYKAAKDATAARLLIIAEALESQCQTLESVQQEMRKTVEGGEGLMQAICAFSSAKWAGLDVPDFANGPKARDAVSQAKSVIRRGDIAKAPKMLTAAKEAVQAFDRELNQYRTKLIGAAESITTGLEFTRDTSFAVAEQIATATLIARGTNPKLAKTSSAAFFAALQSGATEYGEHLADPKKSWGDSAQKILVDTLVATATSIITNGFNGDSIKKWAGNLAPRIAANPPFKQLGTEASKKFIEKVLSEGGQKLLKDGMKELIKTFGQMAKSGRVPTAAEVEKQILDYVTGEVIGEVLKKFDGATWKVMRQIEDRFVDKNAKSLGDWFAKLGKAQRAKILMDIVKKYEAPLIKLAVGGAIDSLKSDASESEIVQKCTDQAMTNRQVLDIFSKELEKLSKQRT
jgi:hypothetical protein